ncbi:hypothetical protein [uncultured Mobiluncus sp.]|uniref:hypothetical protein n=1 Tax=uncultured Mobiluncus sp. TaxID=293425 RepID=UPI002631B3C0|nr:hypothetical protein [uncultured Mobiluncus sp.]
MIRKIAGLCLAGALVFSLTACGNEAKDGTKPSKDEFSKALADQLAAAKSGAEGEAKDKQKEAAVVDVMSVALAVCAADKVYEDLPSGTAITVVEGRLNDLTPGHRRTVDDAVKACAEEIAADSSGKSKKSGK